MRTTTLAFLLITTILTVGMQARADEPSAEPSLQIDTGNHTGYITQIATDAKGKWLATASSDKTVRIWDLQSNANVLTIRVPVGNGPEGTLSGVAMSPDGALVATAGETCFSWDKTGCIYIYERSSGNMVRRITGLKEGTNRLAWSPDGKLLAAGLFNKGGLRVYETTGFTEVGVDGNFEDHVESLDFSRDGRLLAVGRDGSLRLYRVGPGGLVLQEKRGYPQGKLPLSARFSPDGSAAAVGFTDSTAVIVVSATNLEFLYAVKPEEKRNGRFNHVAWSSDGNTLYAAGNADSADGKKRIIRFWPQAGRGASSEVRSGQRRSLYLLALPAGGVLYTTNGAAWGGLDSQGKQDRFFRGNIAQFWGNQDNFRITPDGQTVRFGFDFTTGMARFNLREGRYEDALKANDLLTPITAAPGIEVKNWRDRSDTSFNGVPLKLRTREFAVSLAISPDSKSVVLGTYTRLRKFDPSGKELWARRVPGTVDAVNINADSKLIVAAYQDGTIRWHRLSDGAELVTLFAHADRKRWVAWTPAGYYMASPGAEDLIGWHFNRGKDSAADFFPASRFRGQFYRPDVVAQVFETLNEADAIRVANAQAGRKLEANAVNIQDQLPPVLDLVAPPEGIATAQASITLKYSVRSPKDAPVTGIRARINGQVVNTSDTRNLSVGASGQLREITLTVPTQDSEVALFAENKNGVSVPATTRVLWRGEVPKKSADAFEFKPKLYVLSIGVSLYDKPEYRLGLANKDARDFAASLQAQKGKLYRDVEVRLLTDKQANRDAVLDGLDWLQKQVTAKDVGMLFMAGHGINDANGTYYYMPSNADVDKLKSTAVVFGEIKNTLSNLAGKALFFVDTCHSGNVLGGRRAANSDTTAVINELASAENGVVVFSSSTGKQYSLEDPQWGNGAFTKALVEGFNGKADYNRNGRITHKMLDFYLSERVKELTGGQQTPVTQAPGGVPDFPIALSK